MKHFIGKKKGKATKYVIASITVAFLTIILGLLNSNAFVEQAEKKAFIVVSNILSEKEEVAINFSEPDHSLSMIEVKVTTYDAEYFAVLYFRNYWMQLTPLSLIVEPEIELVSLE